MTKDPPLTNQMTQVRASVNLDDKFNLNKERVFITGVQALVRLCLLRAKLDQLSGLDTAGYVSGYRGSPLGAVDQQFPQARVALDKANIVFEPALNEDLAATAIWGTQQAEMRGEGNYDGVFAMWYGKGPGVDRSGDVFRHGNLAGTSPHGGVLVLTGDDHTCESSTTCHQSEYALMDAMIPLLNPANVQEILEYGLHGWELSRFSGLWCGLKAVKDNIESSASIFSGPTQFRTKLPTSFDFPAEGLNIRPNDSPQAQEVRLHRHKIRAAQAYVRTNQLDRTVLDTEPRANIGIVTTGKSYMDALQALEDLDINDASAKRLGLSLYKVAMPWPLEPEGIAEFASKCELLIVVEEKRGLIEGQIRELLYGAPGAPQIIGKRDETGIVLFQSEAALNPLQIAVAVGSRLADRTGDTHLCERSEALTNLLLSEQSTLGIERKPYFCAGCPHNSSTVLPEGKRGYAGIGCHWMAQFMDRNVEGYTHMGGEGANWIGESKFSKRKHVFQNLGDGTFNHSGIMAIRAAVATDTNITFNLLYNDAVAMTGGQAHDGGIGVKEIAAEVAATGVRKVAVVSENPGEIRHSSLPSGIKISDRSELTSVQRSLSEIEGVTVLIYDQTCAAEKRRRRKRGLLPDPAKRIFINTRVCEGCGDCGTQSNCVAIVPVETEFGRKRQIDQSSCNKDYSCVNGFCPSFVTVVGGDLRKPEATQSTSIPDVPEPRQVPSLERPYAIALTGVGGTGVVTAGALLGMAAHIEGKGCGIIDMAGLAQKGGAVVSHIKIAAAPEQIRAIRISVGGTDLLLGCDLLVSAGDAVVRTLQDGRSRVLVNTHELMTGAFTRDPDFELPINLMQERLVRAVGSEAASFVNATRLAEGLLGDTIAANLFMLGVAYQKGWIPLHAESIEQAVELNGIAVSLNHRAFRLGRLWVHDAQAVQSMMPASADAAVAEATTVDELIDRRAEFLADYQDEAYARTYRKFLKRVRSSDPDPEQTFSSVVARDAFKLMAYKDEYEVARLYTDGEFSSTLKQQFSGNYKLSLHLAPPLISRPDPITGRIRKRLYGPWIFSFLKLLARMKRLRGTRFDLFGYTKERRLERELIVEYRFLIDSLLNGHLKSNYPTAVEIARLPGLIRGYGHIKEASVERYRQEKERLFQQLKTQPESGMQEAA